MDWIVRHGMFLSPQSESWVKRVNCCSLDVTSISISEDIHSKQIGSFLLSLDLMRVPVLAFGSEPVAPVRNP